MAYSDIRTRILKCEKETGRPAGSVRLVAISKKQPLSRIEAVLNEGHRIFGENRVQEAELRWPSLRERFPDVDLHLVGALQTNKVRAAVALFKSIQTLDRPKLAARIADEIQSRGEAPELFIQVNTGEEPQKAGVPPSEADRFITECDRRYGLPVTGLMALPPIGEEPSLHFALLAKIAARNGLKNLSMGMSADFEAAISFGATHVRIGTALFGDRESPNQA